MNENEIRKQLRKDLGLVNESYVTKAQKYELRTELLSEKTKAAHQELLEGYVDTLNTVSAKLDGVDKSEVNPNHSDFRSLKSDEVYNLNAAFLHAMYFENIDDLKSVITMDSISFMRLERDFGTFEAWQEDFIACGLASRNGWVVTVYNTFLNRYINVVVDLHSSNIPFASHPVIVMDCWEHSYYRDYLKDRKAYIYAMMKELNWDVIEKRFKSCDRLAKITK